jgi:hypothetical protein
MVDMAFSEELRGKDTNGHLTRRDAVDLDPHDP